MKKLGKRVGLTIPIRKILRVTKVSVFLLLLCSFHLSASVMLGQQVNLKSGEILVQEAFKELKKQTGTYFMYKEESLKHAPLLNLNLKNANLEEALDEICKQAQLQYQVQDDYVLVTPKAKPPKSTEQENTIKVKGKVTDTDGMPLPGVSVVVKGTNIGVSTDLNGHFSMKVMNGNQTLIFSFVGMTTQELNIKNRKFLDIVLENDHSELSEVVVTGYQEIKKSRMTGSVETVTAADIVNKGITNVEDAIRGQLAGVSSMNLSGRPGSTSQIRIRGVNSLTGDADPIWILDGMPLQGDLPSVTTGGTDLQNSILTNGIGNISPDDIESITILKDAAATAIYGARAANGVIVVKTKRGVAGKSYINVRSSFSLEEAPKNKLDMMNSEQKIAYETSLYNDFSYATLYGRVFRLLKAAENGRITKEEADKQINQLRNTNTNWFDEIFRLAKSQNHSVSLSGGNEKTQYYASVNYLDQNGIMPNNEYSRLGASVKLTHDFNKKLRIYFDLNTSLRKDRTSASVVDPLRYATFANPYEKPYNDDGSYAYDRTYNYYYSRMKEGYAYDLNILEDLNANTNKTRYVSNSMNVKLEYKLFDGLMFSSQSTFSATNSHNRKEIVPGTYTSKIQNWLVNTYNYREIPDHLNKGALQESTSRSDSYTIRNNFEYAKSFKDLHFVNAIVGQEISSEKSYRFMNYSPEYAPGYGLITFPELDGVDARYLDLNRLGSTGEFQNRSASFFATASYTYDEKYVVSGSWRMDGVDIIGTENRFTPLWNLSGKWNIHKEEFMEKLPFVNVLALRASYGFTGSIDRNAYPFTTLQYGATFRYNNETVPSDIIPGNPSIKWQRKEDRSIGIDFSMYKNRINGSFNYYNNDTRDLLDNKQLPYSTGRNKVKANVASLKNEGYEISLKTLNINGKNFRWTTSFNISFNKNRITNTYFKSVDDLPITTKDYSSSNYFVKGKAVNAWYGYKVAGIDPATGHILAYIDKKDLQGKPIGHLYQDGKYVIDMNTEFTNDALQYLGEGYPPVTGGFGTTFNYKRLSISSQFTFMTGHKIRSFTTDNGSPFSASRLNQQTKELNRWRKPGDITDVAVYSRSWETSSLKYLYDTDIEDGSFLRCTNITLGYNLSPELCEKLSISRLRVSLNVHNLFTFTKYKGIDPETMGAFGYPGAKKYMLGVNIGF
ncbi:SusC/RagA family TonB-linked outer membrane protein [Marinifilum caeruleilacunae]|uniref:TonB-dependent receptor n=1 Tax=Marinifilum caeruleilacunae TaxID=2499076 RepID=A0ABX1WU23_9BACT|nr:TonB-dependent receptor [Marinifilum caeruleilacunae]NOU59608.1 TonB-dependent receptor [Marinifilum caeruleilacunae]